MSDTMGRRGVVARLRSDKGFGFVRATDGHEYFFHRSQVVGTEWPFASLHEGDPVTFDIVPQSPKGPRAENVERLVGNR